MNRKKTPEEIFFKVFPDGEVIMTKRVTKKTKQGDWLRIEIRDGKNRLIEVRERKFKDQKYPGKGLDYDCKQEFTYDDQGRLISKVETDYLKKITRKKNLDPTNGQVISEHCKIIGGPNEGYEWEIIFERDPDGKIFAEKGKIFNQGKNPEKLKVGSIWEVRYLYGNQGEVDHSGKIVIKRSPGEGWIILTKGRVTIDEMKEFLTGIKE